MKAIRVILFYSGAICFSFIIGFGLLPMSLLGSQFALITVRIYAIYLQWTLKYILRVETTVKGLENIPQSGCIIAVKHQCEWETLCLATLFPRVCFVYKKELHYMPVIGIYLLMQRSISVDRSKGRESIKRMRKQVASALHNNRQIIIFPEGTRVRFGEKGNIKAGAYMLYNDFDVPFIPVAHNAGEFWGISRAKYIKPNSTIEIEIHKPMERNMNKKTFAKQLDTYINSKNYDR